MSIPQGVVAGVHSDDTHSFSKPPRAAIELVVGWGVRGDAHAGVTVRHRSRVAVDPGQPNLRQVHLIQAELLEEVRELGHAVPQGGLGENVTTAGIDLLSLPCGTILRFGAQPAEPSLGAREPREVHGLGTGAEGPGAGPDTSGTGVDRAVGGLDAGASGAADRPGMGAGGAAGSGGAAGAMEVVDVGRRVVLEGAAADAIAVLAAVVAAEETRAVRGDERPAVVVTGLRNPCQQINNFQPGLLKRVLGKGADGTPIRRAGIMAVVLRGGVVRPGDGVTVELPVAVPHRALDRV
ncbi:MOSC domain-containing protein [Actinoplanes sp. NPDC051859]|uniref:MOSC domain-containing protein n=1 Tax=Actinoplanes sp. NPDC051859 TaxID=3363909 RepID=UPI00379B669C